MPELIRQSLGAVGRIDAVPLILEVVCRMTGMGFAAVARVTEERWIACAVRDEIAFGLAPGGELEIASTICDEVRDCVHEIVIDHVAEDPIWRDHHTPARYGFQSYISMPIIRADGSFFGTLCAIDPAPHRVSDPAVVGTFRLFADLIAMHLDARERLDTSMKALAEERATAALRDRFIGVLGHDLRNPLAAIEAGTTMLGTAQLGPREAAIVARMAGSARRMAQLIDDVLDLARGRLGGGLPVRRDEEGGLAAAIEQVVAELRAVHTDRAIEARVALADPVACDQQRMMQLVSNLLGNALIHGDPAQPVRLTATSGDGAFRVTVANGGAAIPASMLGRLFQPFVHAGDDHGGLGLGLYIAAEIAKAHGGTIEVASDARETVFTFAMASDARLKTPADEALADG